MKQQNHIILRAYLDTNALARPCSTCHAEVNEWCMTPDDRVRKVPCVARAVTGGTIAESAETDARDFTEPSHPFDYRNHQPQKDSA
ncbi:hypothetical protein A5697_20260 [Mycobacterium sp. E3251]|uniref:zinc finger domain-containing protein n=1 Tax=Mycobacterium sp. E3251 TaxID=1834144 RepID=UPI0007FF3302|nr:hypothetical protein [Mycobacterium sp. E3251]OBG96894.1 hypothetical protein A5697_20260 [Mycobacterium sp. E3251]